MLIGYARVSKTDGSQNLDLQKDALQAAGVDSENIYQDEASGKNMKRPALEACLKALRKNDALVVIAYTTSERNVMILSKENMV